MKYTFIKTPTAQDENDSSVVTYEANESAPNIDCLLDHFQKFLSACGYLFRVKDYFMLYNPDDED